MNLTLSLLTGLLLLLPGLTAVVTWNLRGARAAARRPDLALTAVSALFAALAVSMAAHGCGYLLGEIATRATSEMGLYSTLSAPYPALFDLALTVRKAAEPFALFEFGFATFAESLAVWRIVTSPGLDAALHNIDGRGQGWVFEHIVRPHANGYVPIAYVLTDTINDGLGIGYQGSIAEIRQGEDGKVVGIALGAPQRFLYELRAGEDRPRNFGGDRRAPKIEMQAREWLGGVVVLDGAVIRNIVVHNLSDAELDDRLRRT